MDAANYLTSSTKNLRSSVESFTDEIEGELEKCSICGVHLTRKVTVSFCACLLVLGVAIVVAVSVGTTPGGSDATGSEGLSTGDVYTKDHRYWSLGEKIESSVGEEIFQEGTSENRALHWLAEEDPLQLPVTSTMEDILERFILANLYIATNGPQWNNQYDFLSAKDVCEWNDGGGDNMGVFCEQGKVYSLNFHQNGLSGTIPDDIGLLTNTREFRLDDNAISGIIPKSLGLMKQMKGLDLSKNKIHGVFPQSLALLKALEIAKFSHNQIQGFDGIGLWKQLPNLVEIHVNSNNITGFVGDWVDIPNLILLDCTDNQIDGTLPANFGVDLQLRHVFLGKNQIQGPIPPGFFNDLSMVKTLNLSGNQLTGPIPGTLSLLQDVEGLYFNANMGLIGPLPQEISALPKLKHLDISHTQIIGEMDPFLCNDFQHLETLRVDCLLDDTAASCATECCNRNGYCCDMIGQTACELPSEP